MEIFYTPEDVEKEYGIETKMLSNWRANLIGPSCIKWRNKILYHSAEIEDWFETQNLDTDNTDPEPEENPKPESESMPKPETKIAPQPEKKPPPEKKIYENTRPGFLTPDEVGEKYRLKTQTLANWRSQGRGPRYQKFANRVYYPIAAIDKWIESSRVITYQRKRL